jgi:hypothetical protein
VTSWLVVLLLAPPAVWLVRCVLTYLSGERVSGSCKLCVVATFVVVIIWPRLWHFAETSGVPLLIRFIDISLPDDIGGQLLAAGICLLAVGGLLYLMPWQVRRWDRQRFPRRPQYFHGSRLLPSFFPKGSSNDDLWQDVEGGGIEAADDGGFDAGGAGGGDGGGVD